MTVSEMIAAGKAYLGLELGSTRIKAVLLDPATYQPVASGTYDWENELKDGIWTYSLEAVKAGVRGCYAALKEAVRQQYGVTLTKLACAGISAMMHGYLAFDRDGTLLVPFRTWRNTVTAQAAEELTALFGFNIPQRWSVAHLYQAILSGEPHVGQIARITTLSGYVHTLLTGETALGIGDASGMFPIDSETGTYDAGMLAKFNEKLAENGLPYTLEDLLPAVKKAGEPAGTLTDAGARFLDPAGDLLPGVLLCPPEGDAGTGMVATNSVRVRTGNVSAGTSVFAMVVLEKALSHLHTEIDMVTTPDGLPVAMAHCNNCTSDLNAWADLFAAFAQTLGVSLSRGQMLDRMFALGGQGDPDCGDLCAYNYFSGEPVTGLAEGRPMFLRRPDAAFTLPNFMRTQLYAAMATLKIGMDILTKTEQVAIDRLLGHGGYFKAENVGQSVLAAALNTEVSVMQTAAEGGAYGMALLAAYADQPQTDLPTFLDTRVFADCAVHTVAPKPEDVAGFERFIAQYKSWLPAQKAAAEAQ